MLQLLVVFKKWSKPHGLIIVQLSLKSRSVPGMVNGSRHGASWQMCVWSLITLEALAFEKWSKTYRRNIVDADDNNNNVNAAARKWSICCSCLLKQLRQICLSVYSSYQGPSCSKLTMSLVNDSLKFTLSDTQICWNFLLKKCE